MLTMFHKSFLQPSFITYVYFSQIPKKIHGILIIVIEL